jgi:hypothetical protein
MLSASYRFSRCGVLFDEMISASAAGRRSVWRLRVFATALAVVGQLAIFGAYLTLARDESSTVSHTEQSGTDLHHGHNDATCAACTALSFQATVNPIAPPIVSGDISGQILTLSSDRGPTGQQTLPNSCRAPPREV